MPIRAWCPVLVSRGWRATRHWRSRELTAGDPGRTAATRDCQCSGGMAVPVTVADEPVPAGDGGFDIFAVHERLISDYRGFTEGSAVIRDDRIAKFIEEDLDSQVPVARPVAVAEPVLRRRRLGRGSRRWRLAARGVRGASSRRARPRAARPATEPPIRFYRHQRGCHQGRPGRGQLRADHRHRVRASRCPTSCRSWTGCCVPASAATGRKRVRAIIVYPMNALANSQLQRAEEVPAATGSPRASEPVTFARYTGQERQADAGPDPQQPAGHPADELRDAGAHAHPAPGPADADPHGATGWSSSSSTSCTPTAAGRARTSRCSSAG